MNWRLNGILLLVISLLGSWYYFYEIRGSEKRSEAEREAARLTPGLSADRLQTISIRRMADASSAGVGSSESAYVLEFVQTGEQWFLKSPVSAECDPQAVNNLAATLSHLERGRLIATQPESLDIYGLDKPGFVIDLVWEGSRLQIRLGNENPAKDAFYAVTGDRNDVFLIDNAVKSALVRKAIDYRDRRIIAATRDAFMELTVEIPAERFGIRLRKTGEEWVIRNGDREGDGQDPDIRPGTPADDSRIQEILGALTVNGIDDFIDEPVDAPSGPDPYGFSEPAYRMTASYGLSGTVTIEIGAYADPGGKTRYARRNRDNPVLIIRKDLYDLLIPDYFHYRSKTVCDMNREVVDRIVIESAARLIELQRNESGGWQLLKPARIDTDPVAAGAFLSNLTYLRATGINRTEEPFGDTDAVIRLYASSAPDTPVTVLQIGGSPLDGVGRWIKTDGSPDVFRISEADADGLMPDVFYFRDKTLLRFEKTEVESIRIDGPGRHLEFSPDGASWSIGDGSDERFDQQVAENVFWTLNDLAMDAVLADAIDPSQTDVLERHGLSDPVMTVRVTLTGNRVETLYFGHSEEGGIAVWKEHSTVVGAVNGTRMEPLTSLFRSEPEGD